MDLYVWVAICAAWLGFEIMALRRGDDETRPFTYWVREALSLHRVAVRPRVVDRARAHRMVGVALPHRRGVPDVSVIDPKQVRVRCPTCAHPEPVTSTMCMTCGARLDPRVQWETYETNETRTQ